MSVERQAEREIEALERELEYEWDPKRRAELKRAIRDVEREIGEHHAERDRRDAWDEEHGGGPR